MQGQAAELAALIETAAAPRLSSLQWYGIRVSDIARSPQALIDSPYVHKVPVDSGYGFARFIYRDPLTDAVSGSGATVWTLPGLTPTAWRDTSPAARTLEAAADTLIDEFERAHLSLRTHPDQTEIVSQGAWNAFFLSGPGQSPETRAPGLEQTFALIDSIDIPHNFGFAAYFRTRAGTTFRRHYGSSNLRLRQHMCLKIGPDTDAVIDVGGERRAWRLGECLVFDDSNPHEVFHVSGPDRVILNVDSWHPDLTAEERQVLAHPAFGKLGKVDVGPADPLD